ncbi:MAG: hypothetical protein GC150_04720 [Rhizobiales bacterium]|nr:hypothetical protein [Hyphomicrobiales bacterium]
MSAPPRFLPSILLAGALVALLSPPSSLASEPGQSPSYRGSLGALWSFIGRESRPAPAGSETQVRPSTEPAVPDTGELAPRLGAVDASHLPQTTGAYVSAGVDGSWSLGGTGLVSLVSTDGQGLATPPAADCSPEAITHYASEAPNAFDAGKNGLLYGVRTHTAATRVDDMPGYNSCALVVYAILKQAGCKWAKSTADAKAIYDMAWKAGWRPSDTQRAGCLVAWNSHYEGPLPRIGRGVHVDREKKGGVLFRHVGVTIGEWMAVDNSSAWSKPEAFITVRPFRYEPPIFLCQPEEKK